MEELSFPKSNAATSTQQRCQSEATAAEGGYEVIWARTDQDVRAAQRLRYQVFAEEMGANIPGTAGGADECIDQDAFDVYCEHLLVRTPATIHAPSRVVGTYRVLTPDAAQRAGGYYCATEFDLGALAGMQGRLVELGRSCVHLEHRSGPAILALWGALARFLNDNQLDTVIGCASISMADGGHVAASLWHQLRQQHLGPEALHVKARLPLPVDRLDVGLQVTPPPLIKGYLRCGAKILGAPAWDPEFNTADLLMMLRLQDLPSRYRKHFLGA